MPSRPERSWSPSWCVLQRAADIFSNDSDRGPLSRVYLRILIPLRIPLRDPLSKQPRGSRTRSYVDSYVAHIWILSCVRITRSISCMYVPRPSFRVQQVLQHSLHRSPVYRGAKSAVDWAGVRRVWWAYIGAAKKPTPVPREESADWTPRAKPTRHKLKYYITDSRLTGGNVGGEVGGT